jgi:hypothetical protein
VQLQGGAVEESPSSPQLSSQHDPSCTTDSDAETESGSSDAAMEQQIAQDAGEEGGEGVARGRSGSQSLRQHFAAAIKRSFDNAGGEQMRGLGRAMRMEENGAGALGLKGRGRLVRQNAAQSMHFSMNVCRSCPHQ